MFHPLSKEPLSDAPNKQAENVAALKVEASPSDLIIDAAVSGEPALLSAELALPEQEDAEDSAK